MSDPDVYGRPASGDVFFALNALGEIRIGEPWLFLNTVNITAVRQTHQDPLPRPSPGPDGNPILDVWAPPAGRTCLGIHSDL